MRDARQEHKRSWTLEAFFAAAGSTSATSCGCSCTLNTLQNPSWEDPDCFRKASKFQMEIPKWSTFTLILFRTMPSWQKKSMTYNDNLWRYHIDHLVCKPRSNLLHNDASCRIPKHASAAVGASIFTLGSFCTLRNIGAMLACLTNHMKAE